MLENFLKKKLIKRKRHLYFYPPEKEYTDACIGSETAIATLKSDKKGIDFVMISFHIYKLYIY